MTRSSTSGPHTSAPAHQPRRASRGLALVAAVAVAAAAPLAGCSGTPTPDPAPSPSDASGARTAALWADRTAHVGDNSKVIALVHDAGLDRFGERTISLQTSTRPYGVTVRFPEATTPANAADLTPGATLVLGTVGNLDRVTVESGGSSFTLTAEQASTALGHDVKTLGTDRAALARYVATIED